MHHLCRDREVPHVALICCHPGPIGGMETFARFFTGAMLTRGWRVTIGLSGQNIFEDICDNDRLRLENVAWLDGTCAGDREYALARVRDRARWFRRVRPDVALVIQSSNTPFRAAIVGARLAGVPVVTTHRTMPYVIPPVPSRRYLWGAVRGIGVYRRRHVFRTWLTSMLASRIVYNSARVRADYERDYRFPRARGVVIPNAVGAPASPPPKRARNAFTVGYVGRLSREKSLDTLLRAIAEVRRARPVCVLLYGDGPERQELGYLARDLRIDDIVSFCGETADVWSAYAQMDAVVLCSPRESSSNMVLEAMAAGRPVIVPAVGGMPELVRAGQCGRVVPPRDVSALSRELHSLADDPAIRARLGNTAAEIARSDHDPCRISDAWCTLLREVAFGGSAVRTLEVNRQGNVCAGVEGVS